MISSERALLCPPAGIGALVDETLDKYAALDKGERVLWRGRFDRMLVVPRVGLSGECLGLYDVYRPDDSADGTAPGVTNYVVDLQEHRCDCPFDGGRCKHAVRVEVAMSETALPAPGEHAAPYWDVLDDRLDALADRPDLQNLRTAARKGMVEVRMEAPA